MQYQRFFWLHIKKSAGITTRHLLSPYYVEVDRTNKPKNFIQSSQEEYNDIINNYRVVLGEYQFKRCQFAKKYLYTDQWNSLYSFAFSREPVDRCISMFYYLFWERKSFVRRLLTSMRTSLKRKRLVLYNESYAFDVFLEHVQQARLSNSIFHPLGLHFTTHTAPMWDDITDEDGVVLLTSVFRLENLIHAINLVFERCGISKRISTEQKHELNKTTSRSQYRPTVNQLRKIEAIYHRDFKIYECAKRS